MRALLTRRRSTRGFGVRELTVHQLAALAWSALGRTPDGRRTVPSAHARYPLALTAVTGGVEGLAAGIHAYDPEQHALTALAAGDYRDQVAATTLADHDWLREAGVLLLLSGDLDGTARHFADQPPTGRGERYVWLEAGHAGQNIYLQAAELGIGAVLVAGFDDRRLRKLAPAVVPAGHHPLALFGIGCPP